jgi:hypothetical protein
MIFKRLTQHLESNNILATEQFGFRKGVHIENAVFSLTDKIITSLKQRQQVGVYFANNQSIRLRQPLYSFKQVTFLWNQRGMSSLV